MMTIGEERIHLNDEKISTSDKIMAFLSLITVCAITGSIFFGAISLLF